MESQGTAKQKGKWWATVLENRQIRNCYYRLVIELDSQGAIVFRNTRPGQFAMLDLTETALPKRDAIWPDLQDAVKKHIILRRPFSFSDVSSTQGLSGLLTRIEIMYCVLGPSTVRMTSLAAGDTVSILGPLGNGFTIANDKKYAIMIAGGMGSPPLIHLASYLKAQHPDIHTTVFAGAKSIEHLPFTLRIGNKTGLTLEEFQTLNVECHIATDDGSAGFKGYVTACVEKWLLERGISSCDMMIYACGPEPMLAAAAKLAAKYEIACQVSMERLMACGIGLCQSCAVECKTGDSTDTQYHLCCKEGPVFDARQVVFNKEGQ